jgi:hypothetical protein
MMISAKILELFGIKNKNYALLNYMTKLKDITIRQFRFILHTLVSKKYKKNKY